MAMGHLKILLLLLGIFSRARGQLTSPAALVPEISVSYVEPKSTFDLFSICPGNYTSCFGVGCQPYVPTGDRCVACECPHAMNMGNSASGRAVPRRTIKLGPLSLRIGSMNREWWAGFLGSQSILPKARQPYFVHNITMNSAIKGGVFKDLSDLLANFSGNSVAMPVLIKRRSGVSSVKKDSEKMEIFPGIMHLPFRINASKDRPLPGLFFPRCLLMSSRPYNKSHIMSDGEKRHAADQFQRLLRAPEVIRHLGKIVSSVWPHISENISISCGNYPSTVSTIPPPRDRRLLSLIKRFSVSINGTSVFNNILQSVDKIITNSSMPTENLNIAKQLKKFVEQLPRAFSSTDNETAPDNKTMAVIRTMLQYVSKNFHLIQSMFASDGMWLHMHRLLSVSTRYSVKFRTVMPGWPHSVLPDNSSMSESVIKESVSDDNNLLGFSGGDDTKPIISQDSTRDHSSRPNSLPVAQASYENSGLGFGTPHMDELAGTGKHSSIYSGKPKVHYPTATQNFTLYAPHFNKILNSLLSAANGTSDSVHKSIILRLHEVLQKLKAVGDPARMDIKLLKSTIEEYKTIAHKMPKDRNFYWIDELLDSLKYMMPPTNSSDGCIVEKLSRHIHNLSFKKFVLGIAKHVCKNISFTKPSKDNDLMQRRVNETVRLLTAYNNSSLKNGTLYGMQKIWDKYELNGTYEARTVRWILVNLTRISKLKGMQQKYEISKFLTNLNGNNSRLPYDWIPSKMGLSSIRSLIQKLSNFSLPFRRFDDNSNNRALCNIAKNLSLFGNGNASFADVTSKLSMLASQTPGWVPARKRNLSRISAFMQRHGMAMGGNLTALEELITSSGREFISPSKPMSELAENLTKLAMYFPHRNATRIRQCIQQLKNATDNSEMIGRSLPIEIGLLSRNKTRLGGCMSPIFAFFTQKDAPFDKLKSIMGVVSMTSASHPKRPQSGYTNTTGKTYYYGDHNATRVTVTNDCTQNVVPGLIVPRNTERKNDAKSMTVNFKTARGRLLRDSKGIEIPGVFYNWGLLWLKVGAPFKKTEFLFRATTTGEHGSAHSNQTRPQSPDKLPFELEDEIAIVFARTSINGDVIVEGVLGPNVTKWAVRRKHGSWIVTAEPSKRKTREVNDDGQKTEKTRAMKATAQNNCPPSLPNGFRCLQEQDIISSSAVLRLLTSDDTVSIGVLTFAPLGDDDDVEAAFADHSKAKNLVAAAVPTVGTDRAIQGIEFGFSPAHDVLLIREGEEKIMKIQDIVKIVSVAGFVGLDSFRDFPSMEEFWADLRNEVKLPSVKVTAARSLLANDLLMKYRKNSSSSWRILKNQGKSNFLEKFESTGEFSLLPKIGFTRGIKYVTFSLKSGKMQKIKMMIVPAPKKLRMIVRSKILFPPVPFDLSKYQGFTIENLVSSLAPGHQNEISSDSLTGLAIVENPLSDIGEWQLKCQTCTRWESISDQFEAPTRSMSKRAAAQLLGRIRRVRQLDPGCYYEKSELSTVMLLNSSSYMRFRPMNDNRFWTATEAWTRAVITLALYRIPSSEKSAERAEATSYDNVRESIMRGSAIVTGAYGPSCVQSTTRKQVFDLRKLLSPEKEKFAIERLGCDERRSSMKLVTDVCGVCGGRNDTCFDCNGDFKGTAKLDRCGNCVEGNTNRLPKMRDCAMSCRNTSYEDECGFCQTRGKALLNVKDCAGVCFGKARLDKCGACRRKDSTVSAVPAGDKLMDMCGVCGGNNSTCLGCDGMYNSEKVTDKCGNCKLPSDESFNKGCGSIYFISSVSPAVLVVTRSSATYSFQIRGYFYTHKTAECTLRSLESSGNTVSLGEINVNKAKPNFKKFTDDAVHTLRTKSVKGSDLLLGATTFAKWNMTCQSKSDSASLVTALLVRSLDPWNLTSINPNFFPVGNGGGNVIITGTNFPQNEDLVCAAPYFAYASTKYSFGASKLFRAVKMMKVNARFLNSSHVQCLLPNITTPAKVTVYVLTQRGANALHATTMHRYVRGGVRFEYREKAPAVKAAILTPDLEHISIQFDTDVAFVGGSKARRAENLCEGILELNSPILGKRPACSLKGSNGLLIRPGKGASMAHSTGSANHIGTVTIKSGAAVGRSLNGATQPFPQTNVAIKSPNKTAKPMIHLRGLKQLEPCQRVVIGVYVSRGVGPWTFEYKWHVEVEEYPKTNSPDAIVEFLKRQTDGQAGKMINFADYQGKLQTGGSYTISVHVKNALSEASKNASIRFHIKSHNSALRVAIRGAEKRIVRSSVPFSLQAIAKFLKPPCNSEKISSRKSLNANSVKDLKIQYVWEAKPIDNGVTVEIPPNTKTDERILTIPARSLKPGKYNFTVTAMYFKAGVHNGSAAASVLVTVESGPIFAHISGARTRVVMSDGRLLLDGSRSVDPNGGELFYSWTCEVISTGAPCSVLSDDPASADTIQRADSVFMADAILDFPARRFTTGLMAKITLTVQSGERIASDAVVIVVQDASSNLPAIEILQRKPNLLFESFPVGKKLRIRGAIVGNKFKHWRMVLKWTCVEEEGLAYLDVETVNMTATQALRNITQNRRSFFSLVLQKNALLPGSTYKFQLRAQAEPEGEDDEAERSVYAEIQVKTTPMPTGGSFAIAPTNGTALDTMFTMRADGWVGDDERQVLNYRFAYRSVKSKRAKVALLTFLGSYTDQPEIATYLPEGAKSNGYVLPVVLLIRIDENDDTTRLVETNVEVRPAEVDTAGISAIDEEVVANIANQAAEALVSGDRAQAVSNILLVGRSVKSMTRKKEMRDLADKTIKKMEAFKPTSENDAEVELDSVRNLLTTFDGDVSASEESKEIAIEMIESTLKELYQKKDPSSSTRRRREIEETPTNDMSAEMAEIILSMYDTIFQSTGNNESFLAESRIRFEDHSEFIMKSLCSAAQYGEQAQIVDTGSTVVGVNKVEMPYADSYGQESPTFSLASDIEVQYSEWRCDPSVNDTCAGACISFGSYDNEVIQSYEDASSQKATRISPISAFFVRNPSDGSESSAVANITGISNVLTITYKNIQATYDEAQLQCRYLDSSSVWTDEECSVRIAAAEVVCDCNRLSGYFAVFTTSDVAIVETSTQSPTSLQVSTSTAQKSSAPPTETTISEKSSSTTSTTDRIKCLEKSDCEDDKEPPSAPPASGLGTAAIVCLTIGLVVVSVTLIALARMYNNKLKERRITPNNNVAEINAVEPLRYVETRFPAGEDNKALIHEEGAASGKVGNEYCMDPIGSSTITEPPPEYSEKPPEAGEE